MTVPRMLPTDVCAFQMPMINPRLPCTAQVLEIPSVFPCHCQQPSLSAAFQLYLHQEHTFPDQLATIETTLGHPVD
jgi:hypothetical protein